MEFSSELPIDPGTPLLDEIMSAYNQEAMAKIQAGKAAISSKLTETGSATPTSDIPASGKQILLDEALKKDHRVKCQLFPANHGPRRISTV